MPSCFQHTSAEMRLVPVLAPLRGQVFAIVNLGQWLQTQRKWMQARGMSEAERKAKGVRKASPLRDEEVSRLEALGVVRQPGRRRHQKNE